MSASYPKNKWIRNSRIAEFYLRSLRKKLRLPSKLCGLLLNCEILCPIPERLFLPHPYGIVVGEPCTLDNDVVLLQQVTLGGKSPYFNEAIPENLYPILKEGAYVGPGAKILGKVTVGEWAVIGANAVVTRDVPPHGIVVAHNQILRKRSTEL